MKKPIPSALPDSNMLPYKVLQIRVSVYLGGLWLLSIHYPVIYLDKVKTIHSSGIKLGVLLYMPTFYLHITFCNVRFEYQSNCVNLCPNLVDVHNNIVSFIKGN